MRYFEIYRDHLLFTGGIVKIVLTVVLVKDGSRIRKYILLESLSELYPNAPLLLMLVNSDAQSESASKNLPYIASSAGDSTAGSVHVY